MQTFLATKARCKLSNIKTHKQLVHLHPVSARSAHLTLHLLLLLLGPFASGAPQTSQGCLFLFPLQLHVFPLLRRKVIRVPEVLFKMFRTKFPLLENFFR